jgi:hypothetical protein
MIQRCMGMMLCENRTSGARILQRVRHEPEPKCLAYASIHGLPRDTDDEPCALLAAASVVEIMPITSTVG